MKKYLLVLLTALMLPCAVQAQQKIDERYAAGAVPVVNGFVVFEQNYTVPGKSKAEICELLKSYVQQTLVEGPEQLPQARITEYSPDEGVLAASIEEYMYFKRTNW